MQALLLPLAADWYALELTSVREIVPAPPVTPLPGAPIEVLGVFNLRGDVIPVLDTAALLGLPPAGAPDHLAVVDTAHGPAALTATGVPTSAPLGDTAGPSELPATIARFAAAGRVATLLDIPALVERLHE
jgi:purine-binding chemotaxis protein CheW